MFEGGAPGRVSLWLRRENRDGAERILSSGFFNAGSRTTQLRTRHCDLDTAPPESLFVVFASGTELTLAGEDGAGALAVGGVLGAAIRLAVTSVGCISYMPPK